MKKIPLSTDSKQDWQTPRWLFDYLKSRWPFTLDAAASKENALCEAYYDGTSMERDGWYAPWHKFTFCNPPYKKILPWVEKAVVEADRGNTSVLLLPARLEAEWHYCYSTHCETEVFTPRIAYAGVEKKNGPPAGSMIMIFSPESIASPTTYGDYRRLKIVKLRPPKKELKK